MYGAKIAAREVFPDMKWAVCAGVQTIFYYESVSMVREIQPDDSKALFDYCLATGVNTPYYFPVGFESWHESMFNDCNDDGYPLFTELKTFGLMNHDAIEGYIQFGVSAFAFNENGEKDFNAGYGVIRALQYLQGAENATELLDKATEYFDNKGIDKRYAFFHYLGMSCYARQGKLHSSGFYMEDALAKYSFEKEHENVYFTKCLQDCCPASAPDVSFLYSHDQKSIKFIRGGEEIGGCELFFVPKSRICFLKLIYIHKKLSHQGWGTKCMHKLFNEMRQKGFVRMDTDTSDSNMNAQKYYEKTGFINRGIMRSYCTK